MCSYITMCYALTWEPTANPTICLRFSPPLPSLSLGRSKLNIFSFSFTWDFFKIEWKNEKFLPTCQWPISLALSFSNSIHHTNTQIGGIATWAVDSSHVFTTPAWLVYLSTWVPLIKRNQSQKGENDNEYSCIVYPISLLIPAIGNRKKERKAGFILHHYHFKWIQLKHHCITHHPCRWHILLAQRSFCSLSW
jgi:hypothetical protein